MQKMGVGEQLTLALPVCHQTVKLVEEYSCNLQGLIKRLKIDKKTGNLYIKDFNKSNIAGTDFLPRLNTGTMM